MTHVETWRMSNHKLSQEACKWEHSMQKKWHVQSYEGERHHDPSFKVLEVQNSWRTNGCKEIQWNYVGLLAESDRNGSFVLWWVSKVNCVWLFATPWTVQSMAFSRQNTGVGSLSLLQGIFPTQGLNLGLPHCRRFLTGYGRSLNSILKMTSFFIHIGLPWWLRW